MEICPDCGGELVLSRTKRKGRLIAYCKKCSGWFFPRVAIAVAAAVALATCTDLPAFAQTTGMSGGDALDWVCNNSIVLKPLLTYLLPASVLASLASAWTDRMPPWLAHIVNFVGANWGDIARAVATANPPASASGKK